jgi:disulfide oxidoreductase YuzD
LGCSANLISVKARYEILAKKLRGFFGDQIEIKFVNIFNDWAKENYPEIWTRIAVGTLIAPVIVVDNEPVVNANIAVQPVVDKLIELSLKKLR